MDGARREGNGESTGRMTELRYRFKKEEAALLIGNCKRGAIIAIVATFGGLIAASPAPGPSSAPPRPKNTQLRPTMWNIQ